MWHHIKANNHDAGRQTPAHISMTLLIEHMVACVSF